MVKRTEALPRPVRPARERPAFGPAPKEQPPRKLSGKEDRKGLRALWKAGGSPPHRRGKPQDLRPIFQVPRQRGHPRPGTEAWTTVPRITVGGRHGRIGAETNPSLQAASRA